MRPYFAIAILGLVAASAAQAGEVYKWTDDKGVVHYTDAPPEGRDFEKKKTAVPPPAAAPQVEAEAEAAAAPAPPKGSAQANCEAARRNVENMERFSEISMDRDGDGTAEKLTAEQREEELKRHRALVDVYCPKESGEG